MAETTRVFAVRLDARAAGDVVDLADAQGMTRSDFLAALVDRALVGYDRMTADEARERRAHRAGPRRGRRATPRWAPTPEDQQHAG
jgi:hypothetical protein